MLSNIIKKIAIVFLLLNGLQISQCQDLSENLLVHYDFEEDYLDKSTNSFDGLPILTEFVEDRNGVPNSAINLPGEAFVGFPNNPVLKPQFPLSIAVWINPEIQDDIPLGIFGNDQTLNNYFGAFATITKEGEVSASYGDGCGNTSPSCRRSETTTAKLTSNQWYHIAINFIDAQTFEIYLDGCLATSVPSGSASFNLRYSNANGAIGRHDSSTFPNVPIAYFVGEMDDFYYWDRTLTQEDVNLLVGDFFMDNAPQRTITYQGCEGDGFSTVVNGTLYDEANPSGTEFINSNVSCDSIITIDLIFNPSSNGSIDYLGCVNDGFEVMVNSTIYNESNPTGQELILSQVGCDSIVSINLVYEEGSSDVRLPNIFTPGLPDNNIFRVGDGIKVQILNLQIYDRWGNKVYDNDNPEQEWDGNIDGNPAPSDVYVYTVTYQVSGQDPIQTSSDLTLLR